MDELERITNKRPVLGFEVESVVEIRCSPSEVVFCSVNAVSASVAPFVSRPNLTLAGRQRCPRQRSKSSLVAMSLWHDIFRHTSASGNRLRESISFEIIAGWKAYSHVAMSDAQIPVPQPRSRMLYGVCDMIIGRANACLYEWPSVAFIG